MSVRNRIHVIQGDITTREVDAIVNAANSSLMGGGGVDGAIHRAGGSEILEACRKIVEQEGECDTGEAVMTTAGKLPARVVIHTVGPVWHGGEEGEEKDLYSAYYNSLSLAAAHDCDRVAFPNISTGVYGFPKEKAAKVAVSAVVDFLTKSDAVRLVELVCFDSENYTLTKQEIEKLPE